MKKYHFIIIIIGLIFVAGLTYNYLLKDNREWTIPTRILHNNEKQIEPTHTTISDTLKNIDTTLLFNIWTTDPNGPHADIRISKNDWYFVDSEGDGSTNYEITNNKITLLYDNFQGIGYIRRLTKDSLIIFWPDYEDSTIYVRWAK